MPKNRLNLTPSARRIVGGHGSHYETGPAPSTPPITADMTSWTHLGHCAGTPAWDSLPVDVQRDACRDCPVQTQCATQAIDLVRNDPGARLVHDVIYAGRALREWWAEVHGAARRPVPATEPNTQVRARLERLFDLHRQGQTPEQVAATLGVSLAALADNLRRWCPDEPDLARTYLAARNQQRKAGVS